jgi:hypothetical protein
MGWGLGRRSRRNSPRAMPSVGEAARPALPGGDDQAGRHPNLPLPPTGLVRLVTGRPYDWARDK